MNKDEKKELKAQRKDSAKNTPFYKKKWFIAIIVIIVIGSIGSTLGSEPGDVSGKDSSDTTKTTEKVEKEEVEKEEVKMPIEVSVANLEKELDNNAMKAEKKYQDKYVKISGELSSIDSDGAYINLTDPNNEFDFVGVQCFLENDEQKDAVMEMTTGDIVTLYGTITDIGEVMGYSIDIEKFEK